MTREEVWKAVSESLKEDFGRLLDVRDVRRVRRVAGDAWVVTVVLAATSGDIHVADLRVDNAGAITPPLNASHVLEAVRRADRASQMPPAPPDELAGFGDDLGDDGESDGLGMLGGDGEPIEVRAAAALAKGDPASLHEARELLPRL